MKGLIYRWQNVLSERSESKGFTIIEVMFFLAITALMVVGVFGVTTNSINRQRYRDSIVSLQSFLQQQYSEVVNTSNGSAGTAECVSTAASPFPRGQSNCVILGRYITNIDDKTISVKSVVGVEIGSGTYFSDDITALNAYTPQFSPDGTQDADYSVSWGVSMVNNTDNPSNFSVFIARSPLSGSVLTFVNPTAKGIGPGVLVDANLLKPLSSSANICINSNGLQSGKKSMVKIVAGASSASGVETLGEGVDGNVCL